jgi:hypothetical protein
MMTNNWNRICLSGRECDQWFEAKASKAFCNFGRPPMARQFRNIAASNCVGDVHDHQAST